MKEIRRHLLLVAIAVLLMALLIYQSVHIRLEGEKKYFFDTAVCIKTPVLDTISIHRQLDSLVHPYWELNKMFRSLLDKYRILDTEYLEAVDDRSKMYGIIKELDVTGKYNDTVWSKDSTGYMFGFNAYKFSKKKH